MSPTAAGRPPGGPTGGTVAAPLPVEVEEFLTWLAVERGRAPSTLAAYRRDLGGFLAWAAERGRSLDAVTTEDLQDWIADQRAAGRAPSTVARATVAVRSLTRFLAAEGLAAADPGAAVAPPRVPAGLPKALSEAEVNRLLEAVVGDDPVDRRDRAVLEVLYGTGLRISELVGLDLDDLDLDAALLRAFGKGSKERIVPLGRLAREALGAWLGPLGRDAVQADRVLGRGDAAAVFCNLRGRRLSRQGAWGIVTRHARSVGLGDRVTPHVLRHSCATHMLDHGADVRAVQELLGHASISTTQVYTLVSPERLRAVYRSAHPRATVRAERPTHG